MRSAIIKTYKYLNQDSSDIFLMWIDSLSIGLIFAFKEVPHKIWVSFRHRLTFDEFKYLMKSEMVFDPSVTSARDSSKIIWAKKRKNTTWLFRGAYWDNDGHINRESKIRGIVFMTDGKLHKKEGPAFISRDYNTKRYSHVYIINNDFHREDGPAVIEQVPFSISRKRSSTISWYAEHAAASAVAVQYYLEGKKFDSEIKYINAGGNDPEAFKEIQRPLSRIVETRIHSFAEFYKTL